MAWMLRSERKPPPPVREGERKPGFLEKTQGLHPIPLSPPNPYPPLKGAPFRLVFLARFLMPSYQAWLCISLDTREVSYKRYCIVRKLYWHSVLTSGTRSEIGATFTLHGLPLLVSACSVFRLLATKMLTMSMTALGAHCLSQDWSIQVLTALSSSWANR